MKDALGHGSNGLGGAAASQRVDFARNKIGIASDAQFSRVGARPAPKMTTDDHVADLRNRLAAPKGGLLHSFTQGLKNALTAGAKLHANSFAPTSRN